MMKLRWLACLVGGVILLDSATSLAADVLDGPPINYREAPAANSISRLQDRLDAGDKTLTFDDERGYLKSVLSALSVPVESQMLVFSKTSLQRHCISPRSPRAIYFNDDIYVGYCQSGEALEISAVDPTLGTVFYTLEQTRSDAPRFERRSDKCLICHNSSRTEGVPGHVVRSLFVDASGQPMCSSGSRSVDHTTPLKDRWGGWYVTGTHGSQTHVGNLVVRTARVTEPVDNSQGQNITDLSERFRVDHYLTPHSDIVALMVLEHQTLVHNRLVKANYETRLALYYDEAVNDAADAQSGKRLESTTRRIQAAGDDLVDAMLLVDEAPLSGAIRGTAGFTDVFVRSGPRDHRGRSLRDLDLQTRLLKYPCSYLIYSEVFDALPDEVREYVLQRLWHVLTATEPEEKFAHLSAADRNAIVEILRDTKPGLPEYWSESSSR